MAGVVASSPPHGTCCWGRHIHENTPWPHPCERSPCILMVRSGVEQMSAVAAASSHCQELEGSRDLVPGGAGTSVFSAAVSLSWQGSSLLSDFWHHLACWMLAPVLFFVFRLQPAAPLRCGLLTPFFLGCRFPVAAFLLKNGFNMFKSC